MTAKKATIASAMDNCNPPDQHQTAVQVASTAVIENTVNARRSRCANAYFWQRKRHWRLDAGDPKPGVAHPDGQCPKHPLAKGKRYRDLVIHPLKTMLGGVPMGVPMPPMLAA